MTKDEFKALVAAKAQEQRDAAVAEKEQVLSAINTLKQQVEDALNNNGDVSDEFAAEVLSYFDGGSEAISSIFTPEETEDDGDNP